MPSRDVPEGEFGHEKKALLNMKKILLLVAGAAAKYQMDGKHDLRNEQMIVAGIANIAMDVFITESLLLRRLKLTDASYSYKHGDLVSKILKLFIYDAQGRIVKEATDCLGSFAGGDELSIMLKGVKRFSKYPNINVKEARTFIADVAIDGNGYPLG
jgi:hypothetical protein